MSGHLSCAKALTETKETLSFHTRTLKHTNSSDFKSFQVVRTSKCLYIQAQRVHLSDAFNTCTVRMTVDAVAAFTSALLPGSCPPNWLHGKASTWSA